MTEKFKLDVGVLYENHSEQLLLSLVRRTADPETASELWAETFAQAVAGRRRFRGRSEREAAGWLYAIADRQLAQFYRRGYARQRALKRLNLERQPPPPEVEEDLLRRAGLRDLRERLGEAMAGLQPEVRDAIELRVIQEMSFADVADSLAITETAARTRVSRGLRQLGHVLDPDLVTEVASA